MKISKKKTKAFDTVLVFREIKDKISKEIQDMTFDELKVWMEKNRLQTK